MKIKSLMSVVFFICVVFNAKAKPITYEFGFTADATISHTVTDTEFQFIFDGDTNELFVDSFYGVFGTPGPDARLEFEQTSTDLGEWRINALSGSDIGFGPDSSGTGALFARSSVFGQLDLTQEFDSRTLREQVFPTSNTSAFFGLSSNTLESFTDFGTGLDFDFTIDDSSVDLSSVYFKSEKPQGGNGSLIRYEFGFTGDATISHTITDTEFQFIFDGDTNELFVDSFYGVFGTPGPDARLEFEQTSTDLGEWRINALSGSDIGFGPDSSGTGALFARSSVFGQLDLTQEFDSRTLREQVFPTSNTSAFFGLSSNTLESFTDFGTGLDFDFTIDDSSVDLSSVYFASSLKQVSAPSTMGILTVIGLLGLRFSTTRKMIIQKNQ